MSIGTVGRRLRSPCATHSTDGTDQLPEDVPHALPTREFNLAHCLLFVL